ncbi:MAG: hypothetical protein ACT4O1_10430 [Gemmatimonadota bacterium]
MRTLRLALVFLAAPIAWTLHFLLSYLVVTVGCTSEWRSIRALLLVMTALFAAGALWPAFRLLRDSPRFRPLGWLAQEEQASATPRFLLALGVVSSGVFVLAIILGGIGPLFVPVCADGAHTVH